MQWRRPRRLAAFAFCATVLAALTASAMGPDLFRSADPTGETATYHAGGPLDTRGPFFQSLGTNGRSCATCHTLNAAMGLSTADIQARFTASHGADPLFAEVDGANCRGAARDDASAHSLLLQNGLIRVGMAVPADAQFTIQAVYDPYGCADAADPSTGVRTISVYRRPLPSTNLRFLSAVMFDARETVAPLNDPDTFEANLTTDLRHQAIDATLGHAQAAAAPSERQLESIVRFELNLYSAHTRTARRDSFARAASAAVPSRSRASRTFPASTTRWAAIRPARRSTRRPSRSSRGGPTSGRGGSAAPRKGRRSRRARRSSTPSR